MAKAKRKTLPSNFDQLAQQCTFEELKAILDECELDARDITSYNETALHCSISEELARYLIAKGLNVNVQDLHGCTPLYWHSMLDSPLVPVLLELGADVNIATVEGTTPLFTALANARFNSVKLLLEHGADINCKNKLQLNALEHGLSMIMIEHIPEMLQCAKLMRNAGAKVTKHMQNSVEYICKNFEHARPLINPDLLELYVKSVNEFYELFDVNPVKKLITHRGRKNITITGETKQEQFSNLWYYLVPPCGPAKTLQGEVIRIAGTIYSEFHYNGGAYWDDEFTFMLKDLIRYLESGRCVPNTIPYLVAKDIAQKILDRQVSDDETFERLCRIALGWVEDNPDPIPVKNPRKGANSQAQSQSRSNLAAIPVTLPPPFIKNS